MKRPCSFAAPCRTLMCAAVGLLLLGLSALFPSHLSAQSLQGMQIGVRLEHNVSVMPGLELSYQRPDWFGGKPRFTLTYGTTRLAMAVGSRDLEKDRYQLGAAWQFRPRHAFDPYVQLSLGYEWFNRGDDRLFALLDNKAVMASLIAGVEWQIFRRLGLRADAGLSLLQASTVYPIITSAGLHYGLP